MKLISEFEKKILKALPVLFLTGIPQIGIVYGILTTDADVITIQPLIWLFSWAIITMLFNTFAYSIAAGGYENGKELNEHAGKILGMGFFNSFTAIYLLFQVLFVLSVRLCTGNMNFRRAYPYVVWDPYKE